MVTAKGHRFLTQGDWRVMYDYFGLEVTDEAGREKGG
jgi:hypothetical protein